MHRAFSCFEGWRVSALFQRVGWSGAPCFGMSRPVLATYECCCVLYFFAMSCGLLPMSRLGPVREQPGTAMQLAGFKEQHCHIGPESRMFVNTRPDILS